MKRKAARIRTATLADLPGLLALEAHFPSDQMTPRAWRRFIGSPGAIALVAFPSPVSRPPSPGLLGNLLLLTRKGSRKARVYSVIVAPEARGQGLGEQLVAAGEVAATERGCTAITLEVRTDNPAALALYAKRGYVQTRSLPSYYSDGADGVRLVKSL